VDDFDKYSAVQGSLPNGRHFEKNRTHSLSMVKNIVEILPGFISLAAMKLLPTIAMQLTSYRNHGHL